MNRRHALFALVLPAVRQAQAEALSTRIVSGAEITLSCTPSSTDAVVGLIWAWVERSAQAVTVYYGKFPVPSIVVRVTIGEGRGVRGGRTYPGDVPVIELGVGRESTKDDLLNQDWVMVHEMVHLAFPWMNLKHNWMAEGLAVYVESIARLQAGHLAREQVWGEFLRMMPHGQPKPGDKGLDITVNWGRTYWGGALFCLLADIRIRQETANRYGLQQSLRAINAQRDFRRLWELRETLAIGDAATRTTVLVTQYEAMREDPVAVDLEALWASLGVRKVGDRVILSDRAALASARTAIEGRTG